MQFLRWSKLVCEKLWSEKYWADITDPCSGQPYFGQASSTIYADINANMVLLKYDSEDVGGCRVMAHPEWRFHSYPATLFTSAPFETLSAVLYSVNTTSK
mmetsp:Transcript_2606/g.4581  ORF Transcript_2606/g.4581 Transcript_2606/m.4581 type:complete len:100 (+) Transcript_2606:598-897(+)